MFLKIGQKPDHGFDRPLGLLSDCHRRIEHFLATLVAVSRDAGGGPLTAGQRAQLEAAITYFAEAAPRHTADEEASLFPRLRESRDAAAARALQLMDDLERDHQAADWHHRAVDALVRRWLADGTLPPSDSAELSRRLATLEATYTAHIATEDRELFPAAERLLSEEQVRAIGGEMAARRRARD